jgi:hypothetical protein
MGIHQPTPTSPVLDELLLDIATEIELTDHDREIANRRYQRLQMHLERPVSPLRPFLMNSSAQIYPQGSMSIGTTIVSGDTDDRFDIDAIVEFEVPEEWSPADGMQNLREALDGFPGVDEIVECTRCVQLRFPRMHMDVTILDPRDEPRPPRQGHIFHVPDAGRHERVPSNPYGFSRWYRETVTPDALFEKAIASRRASGRHNRLSESMMEKVLASSQDRLPPVVPPRLDAEQVVALKLLKRHLNIVYSRSEFKRPPSIYFTKHSADVGLVSPSLTDQLIGLAQFSAAKLRDCIATSTKPDERNPTYDEDRLNDRWPTTQAEMSFLVKVLDELSAALLAAKNKSIGDITKLFAKLFGERISGTAYEEFTKRYDQRGTRSNLGYEKGTGAVLTAASVASPSIVRAEAPRQNFHVGIMPKKKP